MTQTQIASILKEMYSTAPVGDKTLRIHLFGIIYAGEIKKNQYCIADIIKISGLKESLAAEISDGMKLSNYVQVINNFPAKFLPPESVDS